MSRFILLACLLCIPLASANLPQDWQSRTAQEKHDQILPHINNSPYEYPNYPKSNPSVFSMGSLFSSSFLVKSFTQVTDEQEKRQKLIHTYGTVASIEMRINDASTYTGIFKAGHVSKGLARLSLAKYDMNEFTPGGAFKFFVDGKPSLNIIAMFSLDGQAKNRNFFANTFWNVITGPSSIPLKLLARAFASAIALIPGTDFDRPVAETNLPLYEAASVDSQGIVASAVVAPYRIGFIPNPTLSYDSNTNIDFRYHLGNVVPGTKLYTVSVTRFAGEPEQVIGEVVATGHFVASPYGDEELFFQHHPKRWRP